MLKNALIMLFAICMSLPILAQETTNSHVYTGQILLERDNFKVYLRMNGLTKIFAVQSKLEGKTNIEHLQTAPAHKNFWSHAEQHIIVMAGQCIAFDVPSQTSGTCSIIGDHEDITTFVRPLSPEERLKPNFVDFTNRVQFINRELYKVANNQSEPSAKLIKVINRFLDEGDLKSSGLTNLDGYYVSIGEDLKIRLYQKLKVSDFDNYISALTGWYYVDKNRLSIKHGFTDFMTQNGLSNDTFIYRYEERTEGADDKPLYDIYRYNRFVCFAKKDLSKPFHKRTKLLTFSHILRKPPKRPITLWRNFQKND